MLMRSSFIVSKMPSVIKSCRTGVSVISKSGCVFIARFKSRTCASQLSARKATDAGFANDTHHVVLSFGNTPFPVLEGQSIGVIAPGGDAAGRPDDPVGDSDRMFAQNVMLPFKTPEEVFG